MFADDTNVTISAKNAEDLEEKLNNGLNNVHNWLSDLGYVRSVA